ncbi:tetratricopeptide repeat protein [Ignavibacteria bacterium]|nr:tetratricopeptide repeat protein [Bacteroidota bacterium]MCZ2132609.1 tetratricopeptide repeat protein [Bacteroidota bacterium]
MYIRTICIILTAVLLFASVPTRGQSDEKYKLAQSYEKSGDLRAAGRLYQELYAANKSDRNFDGVVRALSGLGQFASLAPLVAERIAATAPDAKLYALYGVVLWRDGKTSDAEQAWKTGLSYAGTDAALIAAIATAQSGLRLFDKSIATYLLAREKSGNNMAYAEELAGLYGATGNYERGADEILTVFDARKNMAQAQGQLSALMAEPNASVFIGKKLKNRADKSDDYNDLKLYLWFLRENKDYNTAFAVAERIDKTANMRGRELFDFAEGVKRDGAYEIAIKAYSRIIETGNKSPFFSQALYGYARTLEINLSQVKKLNSTAIEEILDRYNDIIKNFPNTPIAADCQYRRGMITWEYLHDAPKANAEFNKTVTSYGMFAPAAAAAVMSGIISIIEGDLDQSAMIFNMTAKRYVAISPDDADKARYYSGELLYFTGKADSAKQIYNALAAAPNRNIANDALERISFLAQNEDSGDRLRNFAQAELLEMQKKYDDALQSFRALQNGDDDIAERSYMKAANIGFFSNNISEAQLTIEKYLQKFPDAIYGDKAMFLLANIYDVGGAKDKSLNTLTELLARYPLSIYAQEVREKIRKLRGDA